MTDPRRRTGEIGEDAACNYLRERGYEIVDRNARTRAGELDVIACDRGALVFVEVKTMRVGTRIGPERPILAIGPRKQLQVRRLARAWLAEGAPRPRYSSIRLDAIGVSLARDDQVVEIEHIPAAF